jgi:hypothetical protein
VARDQGSEIRGATGKLKAAVRRWLDGGDSGDDTNDALAAFGLVQEGREEVADEPFKVYAINWPTMTIFWATWNQWRKVVLNNKVVRDGIDWTQVEAALTLSGIKRSQWPLIFAGLQAAETEALEFLNEE